MKKVSVILSVIILLNMIMLPVSQAAVVEARGDCENEDEISNELVEYSLYDEDVYDDEEEKNLCEATIDDNFTDDEIIVVLTNETSTSGEFYSTCNFPEIDIKSVNDMTCYNGNDIHSELQKLTTEYEKQLSSNSLLSNDKSSLASTGSIPSIERTNTQKLISNEAKRLAVQEIRNKYDYLHQILLIKLNKHSKQNVLETIKEIEIREDVLSASPNYIMESDVEVDVASLSASKYWGLNNIRIEDAWKITKGSSNVRVGIIDSGIYKDHPDLTRNISAVYNKSFINYNPHDNEPFYDDTGHGTHIAGIIGATHNNIGINGVCKNVSLVSLKCGYTKVENGKKHSYVYDKDLIAAIKFAGTNNIPIINYSYSGSKSNENVKSQIKNYKGLFVCSAGNEGYNIDGTNDQQKSYPSMYNLSNKLSVANMTDTNVLASDSNYGNKSVDIAAPGKSIYSTYNANVSGISYTTMSGTSMAAPFVSGVAALVRAKYGHIANKEYGDLTAYGLKKAILLGANKTNTQYFKTKVTSGGQLDAYGALKAAAAFPEYNIVYEKNGGTGTDMPATRFKYGYDQQLDPNTYTKEGYRFSGWYAYRKKNNTWLYKVPTASGTTQNKWYTEANAPEGAKKYVFADKYTAAYFYVDNNENIKMIAQWTPNIYTIIYSAGKGHTSQSNLIYPVSYDKAHTVVDVKMNYDKHIHIGWNIYRKSDDKWQYEDGSWCVENNELGLNKKLIAIDDTVKNLSTVNGDIVYLQACWLALGDVDKDGVLTVFDATVLQKYLLGLLDFDERQLMVADFNQDGSIDILDATAIQAYLLDN